MGNCLDQAAITSSCSTATDGSNLNLTSVVMIPYVPCRLADTHGMNGTRHLPGAGAALIDYVHHRPTPSAVVHTYTEKKHIAKPAFIGNDSRSDRLLQCVTILREANIVSMPTPFAQPDSTYRYGHINKDSETQYGRIWSDRASAERHYIAGLRSFI